MKDILPQALLRKRTISAFKWNVISQVLNQILILGFNVFLLRLLNPNDFGLFAVPFVFYSFFRMIQDGGIAESFIKESNLDSKHYSSVFWSITGLGIVWAIISYFTSPIVIAFSGVSESSNIQNWMTLALLLGVFFVPFDIMLRKKLDFKTSFKIEIGANFISGCFGIWFAYNGAGWYSLCYKLAIYSFLLSLLSWILSSEKPTFYFHLPHLKKHLNFAIPNITDQALNFFYRNIDTLLIGKFIGSHALGIYDRAYKVLLLPTQQITSAFAKVIYPTSAEMANDNEKLVEIYFKVVRLISLVSFPLMFGIFILADVGVVLLLGHQWEETVPLVKLFALIGAIQSISSLSSYVFYLKDKTMLLLKYSVFSKTIYFLTIGFTVVYSGNIYDVALGICMASLFLTLPLWYLVANMFEFKVPKLIINLLPQLFNTILMCFFLWSVIKLTDLKVNSIFILAGLVLFGFIIYILTNIIMGNKAYKELKYLLKEW